MSAHDAPLSLEELLKLKKQGTQVSNAPKVTKARFLTKSQREKLEQEKDSKLKELVKPSKKIEQKIQTFIEEVPQKEPKNTVKPYSNRKFRFDWDESEDTSNDSYYEFINPKKSQKDDLFDVPYRKRKLGDELNVNSLHWSEKPLDKMNERDWRIMKEDFDISIKGKNTSKLIRSWGETSILPKIRDQLRILHYNEPTPIQRATIPLAMDGNDVLGIAETGSGKTLAFLIPAISYISGLPPVGPSESPYVLIVVPTRELAQQIELQFQKFAKALQFNVASIVGGHTYESNIEKLEKGVEILVGTPGRLLDILKENILELSRCFYLIADEADRMIDMGFEKQFLDLINQLPEGHTNPFAIKTPKRTTMMFTATMPPSVNKMVNQYMIDPVKVTIGNVNNAVETVRQEPIQVPEDDKKKMDILGKLLYNYTPPIIIFVNYQKMCDTLAEFLVNKGFNPIVMHGSKTQQQREDAIMKIKTKQCDILIATDVAARGIDIAGVSLVINYQMSKSISEYIHRIGRTGRGGNYGTAITFWNSSTDVDVLSDLKAIISKSPISKCPDDLKNIVNADSLRNIET